MNAPRDLPSATLRLNGRAGLLADALAADAPILRVGVGRGPGGETLVDCGHAHPGGTEAGLGLARICTAGLAEVALVPSDASVPLPWSVLVRTGQPVLACLASQYAGWSLEGDDGTALLGSGPARALARQEPLFEEVAHEERADRAVLVVEGAAPPPPAVAAIVAEACGLPRDRLTLLHAPTGSLAGMAQVAARALECAVQRARALRFPLADIVDAVATAPLCPPHPDAPTAMGRANDAIIYAGHAHLFVTGPTGAARRLAEDLPSRTSPDWGRRFADVYDDAAGDFAAIDARLFSPALARVTAIESGDTFVAGEARPAMLGTT